MLTRQEVSWKTKNNAKEFCKKMGYKYLSQGAFSVYFQKPEDKGKKFIGLGGSELDRYSEMSWMEIFKILGLYDKEKGEE